MDLFVMDFEKQFEKHLKQWMDQNRDKYKRPEQMEAQVEGVYERWLNSPATWLDGAAPIHYFERFDDAALLIKWMLKYITAGVWVPDPMLDRIVALGDQAEPLLMKLKRREMPLPAGEKGDEAVMSIRNFGEKSLDELRQKMHEKGYLQDEDENEAE
jgi:hypothetical protein